MTRKSKSREKLIFSAKKLFFDKGYISTSVDEIANNVGMSKATIYRCFESKEELLKAVIIEFYGDIKRNIESIRHEEISFEEKLQKFVVILISFLREAKPYLLKDLQLNEPILFSFLNDERKKTIDIHLRGLIQDGIDNGSIKSDYNANIVISMILMSIEKLSSPEFIEENSLTYDKVFRQVIMIIMKGICK